MTNRIPPTRIEQESWLADYLAERDRIVTNGYRPSAALRQVEARQLLAAFRSSPANRPPDWPEDAEVTPEEEPLFDIVWDAISEASSTGEFARPALKAARRILALNQTQPHE